IAAQRLDHLLQQQLYFLLFSILFRVRGRVAARLRAQGNCPAQDQSNDQSRSPCRHPTSTAPPFTFSTSPLMNPAHGVQRKRIGAAISSTRATRPNGMVQKIFARPASVAKAGADISVSTQPG